MYSYDFELNTAYLQLHKSNFALNTVAIGNDLIIDVSQDGTVCGIEFLNANVQKYTFIGQKEIVVENLSTRELNVIPRNYSAKK